MNATEFLHEIAANPDDESARLIYADWLEDRGDARADFVRVQCELARQERPDARTLPLRAAEVRLLSSHKAEWLAEMRAYGVADARFAGGVVSAIEITISDFLFYARLLLDMAPTIRCLKLRGIKRKTARDSLAKLVRCRQFRRIRELDLSANRLGSHCLAGKGSACARLESLDLSNNSLRDAAIDVLTQGQGFARLTRLAVAGNLLTARSVQYLAASAIAPRLTHLDLSHNPLRRTAAVAIASSQRFSNLRQLDLTGTGFADEAALQLASSRCFPNLSTVRVSWQSSRAHETLQERFGAGLILS